MIIQVNENLQLRSRTTTDAPEVYRVIDANRAYLRRWLPWVDDTTGVDTVARVIGEWEQEAYAGTDLVLGMILHEKYVGNIGLHNMKTANNSGMIGYWLAENAQGNGIMSAAVQALMAYGFDELALNRIYIHCAVPNKKSRAIPERLGFTLEGVLREAECLYGQYFDLAVYSLLRREYPERRKPMPTTEEATITALQLAKS